jgi:hypothetical protein
MFPGETVVGFYRRWNIRKERWVKWLEEEIEIGQVREADPSIVP